MKNKEQNPAFCRVLYRHIDFDEINKMRKAIDITGQRFGRLVAIRPTKKRSGSNIVWECQCDCGGKILVSGNLLRSNKTKSCGCYQKEIVAKRSRKNITDWRFGRLVALRPTKKRSYNSIVWECQCDCGNLCEVSLNNLRKDYTKSCGCYQKERIKETQERNITGQRFGRLVALRQTKKRNNRSIVWECQCDCGNFCEVCLRDLIKGNTKSCGCLFIATYICRHSVLEPEDIPYDVIYAVNVIGKFKKFTKQIEERKTG